jgi:choline dehydrogenase-like flavoprotein
VVAGYAIEAPRLLLNSASSKFPDRLANSSGGVNPSLTIQAIACRTADRIRMMAARGEL